MEALWFKLLFNWKNNRGTALTFPYLVGAYAKRQEEDVASVEDARRILDEMVDGAGTDYVVYIRPCPDKDQAMCELLGPDEVQLRRTPGSVAIVSPRTQQTTVLIGPEAAKPWGNDAEAVLSGLIEQVTPLITLGTFSWVSDGHRHAWGAYEPQELEFIDAVIRMA